MNGFTKVAKQALIALFLPVIALVFCLSATDSAPNWAPRVDNVCSSVEDASDFAPNWAVCESDTCFSAEGTTYPTQNCAENTEKSIFEGYRGELLGKFSTDYSKSSNSRKKNIEIAASKIFAKSVFPGEQFSFNSVVGARTTQNGFLNSKIIVNGKFVEGVGGGVCQVSTTLYNAVLISGLSVIKVSKHSLPVSYVSPSFDAMVSSVTDFVFQNDTPYPVRIYSYADGKKLTFNIYGFPIYCDGESVAFRSELIKKIECEEYEEVVVPDCKLPEGTERKIISYPKPGVVSEAYRDIYFCGKLVRSERIRKDCYAPQKGVVFVRQKEKQPQPENPPHPTEPTSPQAEGAFAACNNK